MCAEKGGYYIERSFPVKTSYDLKLLDLILEIQAVTGFGFNSRDTQIHHFTEEFGASVKELIRARFTSRTKGIENSSAGIQYFKIGCA